MRAITFIMTLLLFATISRANEVGIQTAAQWVDLPRMQLTQASANKYFAPQQKAWLFLPSRAWLVTTPNSLETFEFFAGETPELQRAIPTSDWLCAQSRCQLSATEQNRLIQVAYQGDSDQSLALWQGSMHSHRDPYRRALRLPGLDDQTLQLAQDTERWFHLQPTQVTSVFFEHAKKLKLEVRKDLHAIAQNGTVTIKVNGEVISTIAISDIQADEYLEPKVGLSNQDYIAVPKGSYLTITATVPTYVNLLQMHRGIYDDNAGIKQQERLFNPYWSKQLNEQLSTLYIDGDTSSLAFNVEDTAIAFKRKQMLNDIASTVYFLTPSSSQSLTHHVALSGVTLGSRTVSGHVLLTSSAQRVNYITSSQPLNYNLENISRIDNEITLYIRARTKERLTLTSEHDQHSLLVTPSSHFQRLTLKVTPASTNITIKGAKQALDIAAAVNRLQPFPDFLPMTQEALSKGSLIQDLLARSKQNRADTYNLSLSGLSAPERSVKTDSHSQFTATKVLAELQIVAKTKPLIALAKLKPYLNGHSEQVMLMAWQLNIAILTQLERSGNAEVLLKSLLKSSAQSLREYAANELLTRYLVLSEYVQASLLCAAYGTDITQYQCDDILLTYLLDSRIVQEALWTSEQMMLTPKQAEQVAVIQTNELTQPQYSLNHYGLQAVESMDTQTELHSLSPDRPIKLVAKTPLTVNLSARAAYQGQQYKNTQWLLYEHNGETKLLPIFSDIAANLQLQPQATRLSIASQQYIHLAANESLTLFSENDLFVDIKVQPEASNILASAERSAHLISGTDLLLTNELSAKEIAVNTLYQLSQQALTNEDYNRVLQRLHPSLSGDAILTDLYARLMRYGQWQAAEQYTSYVGTQKVEVDTLKARSFGDQITAHLTEIQLSGLPLRANEILTIDFSEYQHVQVRVKFAYSSAKQVVAPPANVELVGPNQGDVISLQPTQPLYYGIKQIETRQGLLQLRWLNPLSGQSVSVRPQYFDQGQWHDIPLDTRQIFYRSDKITPITAKLTQDSLIKIETFADGIRSEATYFHPAGQVSLTAQQQQTLARMFIWTLSPTLHRVNLVPEVPLFLKAKLPLAPTSAEPVFQHARIETDESRTGIEGFLNIDSDDIVQTTEPSPSRTTLDLGLSLRMKDENNWYRIDTFYTMDNHHQDTFSINGQYDWLSQQSSWFAEARIRNRWQDATAISETHLSSSVSAKLGQIHRYNTGFRSIWWWQPFYTYTSISKEEFIADEQIGPDMYTFYRNNHKHGWQAHAGLRYQPWVDSYFSSSVTLTSNQDWQTLDNALFSFDWNQFYQGHIFRAGLTSSYVFADQNRPNPTWQYLTQLGWQTGFDFSHNTAGWLSVTWTQDWFNNTHQIGLQVRLGNLQQTAFAPYAHDEIIFESLQLSHLLEQDLHER
ncbi:hypothetical protein [Pseudoalteromonas sp. S2755]|uniref:hypothetical protein n=1 Tax=Pseudoalteromonas sp. S2755 TaxID=2066523 RepID=UPI00110C0341|nr:hypothetical protein [Pseudoalteromonas sp. S2755]TMN38652.1 hypothetical protein CWC03_10995 [Pseudoalteromonas sp. S2755]